MSPHSYLANPETIPMFPAAPRDDIPQGIPGYGLGSRGRVSTPNRALAFGRADHKNRVCTRRRALPGPIVNNWGNRFAYLLLRAKSAVTTSRIQFPFHV